MPEVSAGRKNQICRISRALCRAYATDVHILRQSFQARAKKINATRCSAQVQRKLTFAIRSKDLKASSELATCGCEGHSVLRDGKHWC